MNRVPICVITGMAFCLVQHWRSSFLFFSSAKTRFIV